MNYDTYFKNLCEAVAQKSKDTSTKVGCVIVGPSHEIRSTGWNGFPRGVQEVIHKWENSLINISDDSRMQRPAKYLWTEHAERNAIYNAARVGIPLEGCTLYCTHVCCHECARAIIQSGIKMVKFDINAKIPAQWDESCKVALEMFAEAGVNVRNINNV